MTKSLRVLIPEDSQDDARLLVRELSKLGYKPIHRRVEDRAGMKMALEEEPWDLILCDYSMPQFTALDALRLVQELKLDIPFIIISGNVGEDVAVQAMKAGAHDYLMKGQLSRLGEAIERELAQAEIRVEHKRGLVEVEHLNHVLRAVRGINRLIVQEKNPEALLQRSAELLVETRGYQSAAFLRTDREGVVFPFVAAIDEGERNSVSLEPTSLTELPACLRTAAEAKHPLVVDEDKAECAACPFRNLHFGRTRLAGPLVHGDKTFGVAVISLPRGLTIQEDEKELFEEMVGDVAFALSGIELAEEERRTQERFQRLYENMAQGVVYQDSKGQVIRCNKAAERVLGLSLSQMQGRTSMDPRWKAVREDGSKFPGEEHPAMLALRNGVPARGVMGVHNPAQSRYRWISISAVPEFEAPGGPPSGVFTTFEDITKIRNAEAQLREAQNIAGLGRWELDLQNNSLQWSESIYELFEVDPASFEATYKAFLGFVHPDDRQALDAAYRQSVASGEPYNLTHRLRMPDGRIKWVKEMGRTRYADDGAPIRSVGTVQDVTDLKTAEEGAEESETRYRALFDGAPIGIFSTTADGKVLSVNSEMARMLGFPSVEATLEHYRDPGEQLYMSPERRAEFIHQLDADGQVTDFEYEARTSDERVIWLNMSARVARRFDDGSFEIDGFTSEITQRKQVEVELARSESLLNLTGRIAKVGGWEFDLSTMRPYLSKEILRIYELPLDYQLPIEEGVKYYHPDDVPKIQQAFTRAVEHGEPYDLEARFISSKGTPKWVLTIGQPHYDDGKLTKLYGTIQDISERKQQELEKYRLEEQYSHAQKMESIGRLAGGIAHDFNNFMTGVIGFSKLALMEMSDDDPQRDKILMINDAGKKAAGVAKQLLAFSRKQVMEMKPVNLKVLVEELGQLIKKVVGEGVDLCFVSDEEMRCVMADAGQIEQVLINLVINARDAMPKGGRITIETAEKHIDQYFAQRHESIVPGIYIMLRVTDTGSGMTDEVKKNLYEPFYSTKATGAGTGLGLSTAYGIIKQHEAFMCFDSEPGRGTTFWLFFKPTGLKKDETPQIIESNLPHGEGVIVVAEDEDIVRSFIAETLTPLGYEIIKASDGVEALKKARTLGKKVDLLLTDVIMPKMGGAELAEIFRREFPETRIVFISGYPDEISQYSELLSGDDSFLSKPIQPGSLAEKVRQTIGPARADL